MVSTTTSANTSTSPAALYVLLHPPPLHFIHKYTVGPSTSVDQAKGTNPSRSRTDIQ